MKVFENDNPRRVYMVMEWIEGRLLRRLLDEEKRLPTERAVRLTIEICEALDYIHGQGVVASALAVMTDRLLNDPIPPREVNPAISPQLQEIIYRALERKPENRYRSAREFANDLQNPASVGAAERPELRGWKRRRTVRPQTVVFYAVMAMIPIVMFILLLITARGH